MEFWLTGIKWHLQRIWSRLTIYQLLTGLVLLWLIGMWLYILPVYYQRMNALRAENDSLVSFIEQYKHMADHKTATPDIKQAEAASLSYATLLALSSRHHLALADYRELNTAQQKQYQVTVKGSWLDSRLLLGDLQAEAFGQVELLSVDIQRDRISNQVALGLVLSEQANAIP